VARYPAKLAATRIGPRVERLIDIRIPKSACMLGFAFAGAFAPETESGRAFTGFVSMR